MQKLRNASERLAPIGLTTLRVVVGVIMAVHGWMKLQDFEGWARNVEAMGLPAPELMAPLAIAGELGGGVLLVLGALTPLAALGVLVSMLVAVFVVHLDQGLLAKNGGFEYPMTLAAAAFFLMLRGGGPFTVDRLLFGRGRARPRARDPRQPRGAFGHEARV